MTDLSTLINILFNLNFKRCKYCNKHFYPQHNRQVHCKPEHRKWYRDEQKCERRRKQRQAEPLMEFVDGHGRYIKMKARCFRRLGTMYTGETSHRNQDFQQEMITVRKQVQALGLK